jgi:hypothetical protein
MKKTALSIASGFVLLACLMLVACQKNVATNQNETTQPSEATLASAKLALQTNLSFLNSFSTALNNQNKTQRDANGDFPPSQRTLCPAFSLGIDTASGFGVSLGFDYGDNGCPNDIAQGIIRKGQITYKYFLTNNLTTYIGVAYQNYRDNVSTFNGNFRTGYRYAANGNTFLLDANNLRIQNPIYGDAQYQTAINYTQQEGASTVWVSTDDVYHITGTTTTNSNLTGFSRFEVLTPLVNKLNCNYIVAGKLKITQGAVVATVDFGNGNCDNVGTIEIGGFVFPITF